MDTVSEFRAKAPQATTSEGLAQGLYVAARVGFEPTTFERCGIYRWVIMPHWLLVSSELLVAMIVMHIELC